MSRPTLTAEGSLLQKLLQGWLGGIHSRVREENCWDTFTNLQLCWGKCLPPYLLQRRKTLYHFHYVIAALSPRLCDPSSRREISTARTFLLALISSYWTGTSSNTYARKPKTSGDSSWRLPTVPPTQGVTGQSCANWAVGGRVPHRTFQLPSKERHTPARRRLREPSTGSSLPVQSPKTGPSGGSWRKSTPTPGGPLI